MYVIDYKHVLCFDEDKYQLLLKLFNGREDPTDAEEQLADELYSEIISGKMNVGEGKRVIGFGEIEYRVVLKVLQGEELSNSEEKRADQMYRTSIAMKKAAQTRHDDRSNGRSGNYARPTRSIRRRDPSESDVMKAIVAPR